MNNMEYKIEDAKVEDVYTIRAIVKDSWIRLYPNEEYGVKKEDLEAIDWFSEKGQERRKKEILEKTDVIRTWVVRDNTKKVVGFCKAEKHEDGMGEIDAIYLLPEIEGKGLGKKLLETALGWLGNIDIKLKVVSYNDRAIEFYKRNGFEKIGEVLEYDGTRLPSGNNLPRIEMLKKKSYFPEIQLLEVK